MGIIYHQKRAVCLANVMKFGQRRQIPGHAKNAIGHNQHLAGCCSGGQAVFQVVDVTVRIDLNVGFCKPAGMNLSGILILVLMKIPLVSIIVVLGLMKQYSLKN